MTISPTLVPPIVPAPPNFLFETQGPFIFPTWGYFGLGYKDPYHRDQLDRLHAGIDIWAFREGDPAATEQKAIGNPVFVVYDGLLGRSADSGYFNVCHEIDKDAWPDLEDYEVCTYYAHLTDVPSKFVDIPKGCTNIDSLMPVQQGELIGYMAYDSQSAVHLHFSVKHWDKDGPSCWGAEPIDGRLDDLNWQNMVDPLPYFGLPTDFYSWMSPFPN